MWLKQIIPYIKLCAIIIVGALILYFFATNKSPTDNSSPNKHSSSNQAGIQYDTITINGSVINYYFGTKQVAEAGNVKDRKKDSIWSYFGRDGAMIKKVEFENGGLAPYKSDKINLIINNT